MAKYFLEPPALRVIKRTEVESAPGENQKLLLSTHIFLGEMALFCCENLNVAVIPACVLQVDVEVVPTALYFN